LIPFLQNRWKIEYNYIEYYGLRAKPYTFIRKIRISAVTKKVILSFDGKLTIDNYKINSELKKLIKQGIIVDISEYRKTPQNIEQAEFCKLCSANTYTTARKSVRYADIADIKKSSIT